MKNSSEREHCASRAWWISSHHFLARTDCKLYFSVLQQQYNTFFKKLFLEKPLSEKGQFFTGTGGSKAQLVVSLLVRWKVRSSNLSLGQKWMHKFSHFGLEVWAVKFSFTFTYFSIINDKSLIDRRRDKSHNFLLKLNKFFSINNISNYKVGRNLLCNRFKPLNNKLDYSWFNESLNTYKVKCKKSLLQSI